MHQQSDIPTTTSSSSSSPPSSTTTTTTVASVSDKNEPIEINDRVPSTNYPATDDNTISVSATIEQLPQSKSDTVSASYTLTTKNSDNTSSRSDKSNNDIISASYTIPSPQSPTTKTAVISKEKNNDVDVDRTASVSTTITATINVPNAVTKKTDNNDINRANRTSQQQQPIQNSHNVSDDDHISNEQQQQSQQNDQRSSRDKRSLFDIDNASSLTLADKLRNEANKYNEVSKSNTDLSQSNDVIVYRKSDSTPTSPHHQVTSAAERRPSWRLKFDAGNKVYICFNSINFILLLEKSFIYSKSTMLCIFINTIYIYFCLFSYIFFYDFIYVPSYVIFKFLYNLIPLRFSFNYFGYAIFLLLLLTQLVFFYFLI